MTDEPDDATVVAEILSAPPAARAELAGALAAVEDGSLVAAARRIVDARSRAT